LFEMVRHERIGAAILLLILLIIVTPGIPTITGNATLMGVSVNDSVLTLLAIFVLIFVAFAFHRRRPDLSTSTKRFKQFYKPRSDDERLTQYAAEQTQSGASQRKVKTSLAKAGWDEEAVKNALAASVKRREEAKARVVDTKKRKIGAAYARKMAAAKKKKTIKQAKNVS
jgi:hypothetical protein